MKLKKIIKKISLILIILVFKLTCIYAMEETQSFSLLNFAKDFFASRIEYSFSNVIAPGNIIEPFPNAFVPKEEFVKTINEFKSTMNLFLSPSQKEQLLLSSKKESIYGYMQKLDLYPNQNIKLIGDIHASAHSLLRNLLNNSITPLIFTGDYTSRGRYGAETWYVLMKLKIQYPYSVFLLKGNHEMQWIAEKFGFKDEICQKYGEEAFEQMLEVFTLLPSALYINCNNNKIQVCHGIIPTNNDSNPLIDQETINELMHQQNYATQIIPAFKDLYLGEINAAPHELITSSIKARDIAHSVSMPTIKILLENSNTQVLLRGHDHNQFAVSVKVNEEAELPGNSYTSTTEKPITEPIPLYSFPAYTLMSCPEGQGMICNVDGYAILTTAENFNDWTITPFQRSLPPYRNQKYIHVHSNEYGFDFSWENAPQ